MAEVLGRHEAEFYYCSRCGYLGAADPHWLDEAYETPIAAMDTGAVERNLALARRCIPIVYTLLSGDRGSKRCVDFAGGHGLFTRLMRDAGFDFYWSDKYAENLFARGFEYESSAGPTHVVTAFEVLEHAPDPLGLLREALSLAPGSCLLFTTELFQGEPPAPGEWWYYAFETGQHVSFFQRRTLEYVAGRLGMRFTSHGGIHALSPRPIEHRLRIAGGPFRRVIMPWLRRRLTSKTLADMEFVRSRLAGNGS